MIDHDRRQRERLKAISLGCLGYFGNQIFFTQLRAPTQSIRIRAIMLFQKCPDRFEWMGL